MEDDPNDWKKVTLELLANKITTFEVVTLPCPGNGGMNNKLRLSMAMIFIAVAVLSIYGITQTDNIGKVESLQEKIDRL